MSFAVRSRFVALGLSWLALACTPVGAADAPVARAPVQVELSDAPVTVSSTEQGASPVAQDSGEAVPIPVSDADPSWGAPDALVTIVMFSDFQCPFCARVEPTLTQLRQKYGPVKLRIVWKNNPLPFHPNAMPSALAAQAVFSAGGAQAFWKFHDSVFADQQSMDDAHYEQWAGEAGVDAAAFRAALARQPGNKVSADMDLARKVGANGTPAFRINGVTVSGAQPIEKFTEVIDAELKASAELLAGGAAPRSLYALRTRKNYEAPPPPPEPSKSADDEPDTTVWLTPILPDDPVRGPSDALVTIVEFSDFQCPFCKRVEATLKELQKLYPRDVRIVWKNNPLPFHPRAMPAALLARLVYQRKGNAAFWTVHDALFDSQPKLEEADFTRIAQAVGLSFPALRSQVEGVKSSPAIDDSIELASDLRAQGTPHFLINGVHLSGAQPLEKFKEQVDAALVTARALVTQGVPPAKVYAAIMKDAKGPPPPEQKQVAAARAGAPARGPAGAAIVVQEFSDFQCPFCKRVEPTLADLAKAYPSLKIVWRHLPLPFHKNAELAAEAAEEVLEQKGNAAFWKYHDELFEAQGTPDGLERPNLVKLAVGLGVDRARFEQALDSHKHKARVEADAKAANDAGINGTPAFVINGIYVSGAQPLGAFKKAVKQAQGLKKTP